MAQRGLADRVTVLGADYRDLEGRYDALVSIEMIEAVDWRRHDEFFATCARLLSDRGRMALQAITIADASYERAKLHDDFIRTMVFPGGCLPFGQRHRRFGGSHVGPADRRPAGHRPALRRDTSALAGQPGGPALRRRSDSASTSASGGSGPSISATARRRSWSATSPTCSWCWPGPGPRRNGSVSRRNAGTGTRFNVRRGPGRRSCRRGGVRRRRSSPLPDGPRAPRRRWQLRRRARAGRAHIVHGSHDRPHRTIVVSRGHRDGHRQWSLHLGDRTAERCLRDIGAKIDDLVSRGRAGRSQPWRSGARAARAAEFRGSRCRASAPAP